MIKKTNLLILFLSFLLSFSNCSSQQNAKNMNKTITEITYHFGDSSVPPPYHRSYTISASLDSVKIKVDSYGEILAQKSFKLDKGKFKEICDILEQCKFANCSEKKNDGCTGGTSESVWYKNENERLFYGSVYHCGGKDYGNLEGDIEGFAKYMKSMIPNLKELLK